MSEDPDHPGVLWPDDDEDPPAWWVERTQRRTHLQRRALAAAAEEGAPVAVVVVCAGCSGSDDKRLGEVRRSSAGLVFDAVHPAGMGAEQRRELFDRFRRRGAGRLPFPLVRSRCVVLLDDPPYSDEPAVSCPHHGQGPIGRDELRVAAQRQRSARPARLSIRCGESVSG